VGESHGRLLRAWAYVFRRNNCTLPVSRSLLSLGVVSDVRYEFTPSTVRRRPIETAPLNRTKLFHEYLFCLC
jgi:hypothetical protein